jgi:hypothetical protein
LRRLPYLRARENPRPIRHRALPRKPQSIPARFHRRCDRGIQEEVTMLELFILAAGFAGGYAASVYSWPWIRGRATGASAEISRLRARAKALEDTIKGAL